MFFEAGKSTYLLSSDWYNLDEAGINCLTGGIIGRFYGSTVAIFVTAHSVKIVNPGLRVFSNSIEIGIIVILTLIVRTLLSVNNIL